MSAAGTSATGRGPADRAPVALLPAWVARLVGFAALACLGVSQWQRMVAGLGVIRPLLWVALAVAAAGAVVASDRVPVRWRGSALLGIVVLALLAAYVVTGLDLALLKPRRLDELGSGVVSGSQALSTVQLPYDGADPWPRYVLELLGSGLVMIAALLAFWPRGNGAGRGYPFLALAALLVLAAAPVVSLGGSRSLLLGAALTLLTVTFLWLERLPLRPGLGVAALIGLALAGALPIAAAADRGQPWFDYQSFAEGLGPKDPVTFDWNHGDYGPITWSRSGAEVARIKALRPAYWKVRSLDDYDGVGWDSSGFTQASDDPTLDLPPNWETQTRWQQRIQVSIQRMRGNDVIGAGTTRDVVNASRQIEHGVDPGTFQSVGDLRSGDSYSADVYVPRPTPDQLAAVPGSPTTEHAEDLNVRVLLRQPLTMAEMAHAPTDMPHSPIDGSLPESAVIEFPPYGREGVGPVADYRDYGTTGQGTGVLRLSTVSKTWELAKRLKAGTSTPYEYALAVNDYLHKGFEYTEKPPVAPDGQAPLQFFLLDSKRGYCQHFSGAMALLLRMGGIPARVATGFSPGGYSARKQAWIVRDTDAHSWVEAWFEGYGWVTMDPTPSDTPARSQIATLSPPSATQDASGGANGAAGGAAGSAEANRRAAGSREALFDRLRGGASKTATEDAPARSGGFPVLPLLGIVLLLSVAAAAVAARRRRPRPSDPLDRAIFELETALRRSGRAAPAGMTLRQLERRLGLSNEAAEYLRAVGAARYGAGGAPPTNAQRKALRRELATGQGMVGRIRTFWALPPRR